MRRLLRLQPDRAMRSGFLFAGLAGAILVTRVGHLDTVFTPPDATVAVFFLAGLWARSGYAFPALLGIAWVADQLAFRQGVSDWCVSPAYPFLIPTYGCLWLAGRASRGLHWRRIQELVRGAGNFLSSVLAAFVISNASFLLLSGYFPGMSGFGYWRAVARYIPYYAGWATLYVCAAVVTAEAIRSAKRQRAQTVARTDGP